MLWFQNKRARDKRKGWDDPGPGNHVPEPGNHVPGPGNHVPEPGDQPKRSRAE